MKPLVSVVITTYNQAQYIAETVLSALNQTYPHREVIVVDDGSTDGTGARLAPFRDRVVLVRQENQGVAASRNTGVRSAKGELIAFLDGDDLWEPHKLAVQVAAYQAHPRSGLIAVDACTFSGSEVLRKSSLPWGTTLSAGEGAVSTGRLHDDLLRGQLIATTSQVMIPARVLEAVGPSDGRLSTQAIMTSTCESLRSTTSRVSGRSSLGGATWRQARQAHRISDDSGTWPRTSPCSTSTSASSLGHAVPWFGKSCRRRR